MNAATNTQTARYIEQTPFGVWKLRAAIIAFAISIAMKFFLSWVLPPGEAMGWVPWVVSCNVGFFCLIALNAVNSMHERSQITSAVRDLSKKLDTQIEKLDVDISKSNVVVFPDESEALDYFTEMLPSAIEVQTTILRYRDGVVIDTPQYRAWMSAKRGFLDSGKVLKELVSIYVSEPDKQAAFTTESKPARNYHAAHLDDRTYPAIPFTILHFPASDSDKEHKVAVFGGAVAGHGAGPYFKTANTGVVELFERYFELLWEQGHSTKTGTEIRAVQEEHLDSLFQRCADKIIRSVEKNERKYSEKLNGTWIYALRNHPTIQEMYGIIRIKHTKDYLIASANVYHVDGRPRGRWWSRDTNYNHDSKVLDIAYDMFLYSEDSSQTTTKACLSPNNYLGVLRFEITDDNKKLVGTFGDLARPDQRGEINVVRLSDTNDADDPENLVGLFYALLDTRVKAPKTVQEGQCYFACSNCGH